VISSPLIKAVEVIPLLGEAVFLDARVGPDAVRAHETAHVSGAIHVDLETDLSEVGDPASGGRHPLPSLDLWLARLGAWAARAWWMLRAIGHESLAVVDGGWQALREAGVPMEGGHSSASPVGSYASDVDRWPTVNAALVEYARIDPSWRVIDARAPERFTGQSEHLDPVGGHIPGACNLYWQSQLDRHGVLESCTTLRERYARILGDVSSERVVCYCGSGVTACHLLLAMHACGLSGAQLYVGSWSEWCRQGRPRAAD